MMLSNMLTFFFSVLLDAYGHVKLGDFGLAKDGIRHPTQGAKSTCGTPEYMVSLHLMPTEDCWALQSHNISFRLPKFSIKQVTDSALTIGDWV
jgi:serine/threonine protein kinase